MKTFLCIMGLSLICIGGALMCHGKHLAAEGWFVVGAIGLCLFSVFTLSTRH